MKVYLASSFDLKGDVMWLTKRLEEEGHEITVKWWRRDFKQAMGIVCDNSWYSFPEIKEILERNFEGIDNSDVLILVCPLQYSMKFNGANVEVGYALAKGKRVLSFGMIERSAMYWAIERHYVLDTLFGALKEGEQV